MNRFVDRTENLFDPQTFICRPAKPSFAAAFLETKLLGCPATCITRKFLRPLRRCTEVRVQQRGEIMHMGKIAVKRLQPAVHREGFYQEFLQERVWRTVWRAGPSQTTTHGVSLAFV